MTKTEICNLALSLVSANTATDIDTDTTPQAEAVRRWFAPARDEALASHPWNFAMKRAHLTLTWTDFSGVALADAGASDEIRVTATSHGRATGQRIHIQDVEGVTAANGTWRITVVDANTFDLDGSVFSGSHTSGTGEWIIAPMSGWDYQHSIPSDSLRVVRVNGEEGNEEDSQPYAIEQGYLLTDADVVELSYVYQHTTVTTWTQDFINAFAYLLASYIASEIIKSTDKSEQMRRQFEGIIAPQKRRTDARSGKGRRLQQVYDSDLVRARRGVISTR
jgi:hypothetical protein